MGGGTRFWTFFGGIWLLIGVAFLATSLGITVFADPEAVNQDTPLWVFALVGALAAIGGGTVIYLARSAEARDRRLDETGISLTATVTDLRRSRIDINRQTRWHVQYRYEHAGRTIQGESRALPGEAVQGYRPGDAVRIKVDPQQPEESLFLGAA